MFEWISTLSPIAQVAAIIMLGIFGCVAVWGYFKWLREM